MATFAVIKNGVVENCIIAESLTNAETITGATCVEYFLAAPGWAYIDGKLVDPKPFIPSETFVPAEGAALEAAPVTLEAAPTA